MRNMYNSKDVPSFSSNYWKWIHSLNKSVVMIISVLLMLIGAGKSFAQVTGTKVIGVDYATLALAVTDLNTNGVGAGGATIQMAAGFTETAPSGGYVLGSVTLNASLSATNTLTFIKSGLGADPLITAPVGTFAEVTAGVEQVR